MKILYDIINNVFGTYYGVDAKYQHMTVIKRKKNPSYPKLRGLVELHDGGIPNDNEKGPKLYYSKYKIRKIIQLMENEDELDSSSRRANLEIEFPQASKRPYREFPG